jgi:hypothetical protein
MPAHTLGGPELTFEQVKNAEEQLTKSIQGYLKTLKRHNPIYGKLRINVPKVRCSLPKPKDYALLSSKIVKLMLTKDGSGLAKPQSWFITQINSRQPKWQLHNSFWTRDLPWYEKNHIQEVIIEYPDIKAGAYKNLSELRQLLLAQHTHETQGSYTVKTKVTFSSEHIAVGKKTYKVINNPVKEGEYSYGFIYVTTNGRRRKVPVEVLKALLDS